LNWSSIATFLSDADEQPVFVIDSDGVVRLCNRALERFLGKPRREVIGQPWQNLMNGARERVARAVRMARQGTPRRTAVGMRSSDGEKIAVDLVLHPVDKVLVGFLVVDRTRDDDLSRMVKARVETLGDRHVLSGREREVLGHLIRGATIEDIGAALGISPRTAKFHQANVLAKLGIATRVELLRLILEPDR
jgi:PAS domain S-box-containing protein